MKINQRLALSVAFGMMLFATASSKEPLRGADKSLSGEQFAMPQWIYAGIPGSTLEKRTGEAKRMTISALAAALAAGSRHAGGATNDGIAAVETSLGAQLPQDFRELYRAADGVPALDIGPLSKMSAISFRMLKDLRKTGRILVEDTEESDDGTRAIDANTKAMQRFAAIGSVSDHCFGGLTQGPEGRVTWLVDLNDPPLAPAHVLLRYEKCKGESFRDNLEALKLHAVLAEAWAKKKSVQDEPRLRSEAEERAREATVRARAELAKEGIGALVERIKGLVPAGVLVSAYPPFHGSATPAMLAAAEARLRMRLPADYRAFLSLQNGLEPFGLWSTAQLGPFRDQGLTRETKNPEFLVPYAANPSERHQRFTQEDLKACVGVGLQLSENGARGDLLLWCPRLASRGVTFLDQSGTMLGVVEDGFNPSWLSHASNWLSGNAAYANFTEWLRDRIALEIHHQFLPATAVATRAMSSTTQRDPAAFDGDIRIRGLGPKFSERDNRKVIAVLWSLMKHAGPMTPLKLLADPDLHLTLKSVEPKSSYGNGGWQLGGDAPMTSVFIDADGGRISIDLDPDKVCIAANAVMAYTGMKPYRRMYMATDGGPISYGPEFQYDAPDGTHFLKLFQGCSEFVEIYSYKGMHMPKRPGT